MGWATGVLQVRDGIRFVRVLLLRWWSVGRLLLMLLLLLLLVLLLGLRLLLLRVDPLGWLAGSGHARDTLRLVLTLTDAHSHTHSGEWRGFSHEKANGLRPSGTERAGARERGVWTSPREFRRQEPADHHRRLRHGTTHYNG